jgi:hypothetical protein
MKKQKTSNVKKISILVGIIVLSLAWFGFVNFLIPFFQYTFTGKMKPETQKKFRTEYLTPLCEKLLKSPVQYDEGISEDEKAYWMTVRYSIPPRFKSCQSFATYPTLEHGTTEFTDTSIYHATYNFGPHQSYVLYVWDKYNKGLRLDGLKGLDDTPLCYGKNVNLESVVKKYMPEKTNRKLYYEKLNNQCN